MFPEKLEECPRCGASDSRWHYDMQWCDCGHPSGPRPPILVVDLTLEDPLPLHQRSPEVFAALNTVADIALRWREGKADLFTELAQFFDTYDQIRAEQIEQLKAQVVELTKLR